MGRLALSFVLLAVAAAGLQAPSRAGAASPCAGAALRSVVLDAPYAARLVVGSLGGAIWATCTPKALPAVWPDLQVGRPIDCKSPAQCICYTAPLTSVQSCADTKFQAAPHGENQFKLCAGAADPARVGSMSWGSYNAGLNMTNCQIAFSVCPMVLNAFWPLNGTTATPTAWGFVPTTIGDSLVAFNDLSKYPRTRSAALQTITYGAPCGTCTTAPDPGLLPGGVAWPNCTGTWPGQACEAVCASSGTARVTCDPATLSWTNFTSTCGGPVASPAAAASPSPKPASPSPKLASPSPKLASPSPKLASPSPRPASPSPKLASPSPRPASPSPKLASPSPKLASPSPAPIPSPSPAPIPSPSPTPIPSPSPAPIPGPSPTPATSPAAGLGEPCLLSGLSAVARPPNTDGAWQCFDYLSNSTCGDVSCPAGAVCRLFCDDTPDPTGLVGQFFGEASTVCTGRPGGVWSAPCGGCSRIMYQSGATSDPTGGNIAGKWRTVALDASGELPGTPPPGSLTVINRCKVPLTAGGRTGAFPIPLAVRATAPPYNAPGGAPVLHALLLPSGGQAAQYALPTDGTPAYGWKVTVLPLPWMMNPTIAKCPDCSAWTSLASVIGCTATPTMTGVCQKRDGSMVTDEAFCASHISRNWMWMEGGAQLGPGGGKPPDAQLNATRFHKYATYCGSAAASSSAAALADSCGNRNSIFSTLGTTWETSRSPVVNGAGGTDWPDISSNYGFGVAGQPLVMNPVCGIWTADPSCRGKDIADYDAATGKCGAAITDRRVVGNSPVLWNVPMKFETNTDSPCSPTSAVGICPVSPRASWSVDDPLSIYQYQDPTAEGGTTQCGQFVCPGIVRNGGNVRWMKLTLCHEGANYTLPQPDRSAGFPGSA